MKMITRALCTVHDIFLHL